MISELIRDGWTYHDTESERLAAELEAANLEDLEGDLLAECIRLSNHTIGEHLADWPRARMFAETIRHAKQAESLSATFCANLAVARFMAGAEIEAQHAEIESLLAADDPIVAYLSNKSLLASALAGSRRFVDAGMVIATANRLAFGQEGSSASDRGMAVANNNIANDLLEYDDLDANGTRLMLECAEAARTFWKRCGTWVNEERALYLLVLVNNRVGNHLAGCEFAKTALAVIAENGEEPVDEAFIRLALGSAYSGLGDIASARTQLARADALVKLWSDESLVSWYQSERAKLSAAIVNTEA